MKKTLLYLIILISVISCSTVTHYEVENVEPSFVDKSPVLEKPMERYLKRKVAITRFSNETNYGSGNLFSRSNDIGKQAMDILSTKLVKTNKFILLERNDLAAISKEKTIANIDSFNISADYLIVGSVTEFGRKTVGQSGAFGRSKNQIAHAAVNIRLVDVKTGRIIYAETGRGNANSSTETVIGFGKRESYNSIINDQAIDAAISKLVSSIIENLTDKPWRSYILDNQDNGVIIAGGKLQGLKSGDVFGVFKKGKTVKNPQTGISIELPGKNIGKLKVISLSGNTIDDEIAICELTEGSIENMKLSEIYIEELK